MICVFLVTGTLLICCLFCIYIIKRQNKKYKELLQEGKHRYDLLLNEYEDKLKRRIADEKHRQLKEAASITHHLSNVISGMNHELSPWIGGIKNKIARMSSKTRSSTEISPVICKKLDDIYKACDSMNVILDTLSRDVKKVQRYNNVNSNLLDTILSWIRLTITDRSIKENVSEENFHIEGESLMFTCEHAPMLLSQVILNLVKNSIEHNSDMLDTLRIKISGIPDMKALVYEDNGKGIPENKLKDIFKPGLTTKQHETELHGLGLSLCQDYCMTMGAVMIAEKCTKGARFVIFFEADALADDHTTIRRIKMDKENHDSSSCRLGTYGRD